MGLRGLLAMAAAVAVVAVGCGDDGRRVTAADQPASVTAGPALELRDPSELAVLSPESGPLSVDELSGDDVYIEASALATSELADLGAGDFHAVSATPSISTSGEVTGYVIFYEISPFTGTLSLPQLRTDMVSEGRDYPASLIYDNAVYEFAELEGISVAVDARSRGDGAIINWVLPLDAGCGPSLVL